MRKLVVIIIVLGIILGGMVAYQYVVKQENIISIQEIKKKKNERYSTRTR